jgi:DNA-binding transcriptional regulator YdaS (Cro superfamily)
MSGVLEAVAVAGGQKLLAEVLGVSQQNVSTWVRRGFVPVHWVVPVEQATGVPRQYLIDPKLVDLVVPRIFD